MKKNLLTRLGYEKLLKEFELLSQVERPRLVQEILAAAGDGLPSSQQDFQRLVARRQRVERRIEQLQQILSNAEVLVGSNLPADQVRFNSQVRVVNLATGQERQFRLVGPLEAEAWEGGLSMSSPLGRALMGRRLGDMIEVDTPGGRRTYQILEIRMDDL